MAYFSHTLWTLCWLTAAAAALSVDVDVGDDVINVVSPRYLSVTLSPKIFQQHWGTFNVRSARLHTLAAGLAPAYLRMGGSAADFLIFNGSATHAHSEQWDGGANRDLRETGYAWEESNDLSLLHQKNYTNFTMTGHDWDALTKFCRRVGFRLLFDLNVFLRHADHVTGGTYWDCENARELLAYSAAARGSTRDVDFQLGNEPNAYRHAFNRTITAEELARDFRTLHDLLKKDPKFATYFGDSKLVGPDITRPKTSSLNYLKTFLDSAVNDIQAVTWHHYYVDGRTASVADFTNATLLDSLRVNIKKLARIAESTPGPRVSEMWMTETSSAWGGGARGLSNRYVAGFMWLDKLGIAAQEQQKIVARQDLYSGQYALLDKNLNPYPDYWLSLLYKKLVGRQVFATRILNTNSRNVRVYAHCTNTVSTKKSRNFAFNAGSITLYILNLHSKDVDIYIPQNLRHRTITEFILTPSGKRGLKSKYVRLNGKKLKLVSDYVLPKLRGKELMLNSTLHLPAQSFGFFVIDAAVKKCTIAREKSWRVDQ